MERTGARIEWLTPVPEVPGSILSTWAPFVVAFNKLHFQSSRGYGQKLIDSVEIKKVIIIDEFIQVGFFKKKPMKRSAAVCYYEITFALDFSVVDSLVRH